MLRSPKVNFSNQKVKEKDREYSSKLQSKRLSKILGAAEGVARRFTKGRA
jgi:hypothetical protein